jgi:hypothetical protein
MKKVILLLIATIFLISFVNSRPIICSENPIGLFKFDENSGEYTNSSCGTNFTSFIYGTSPTWITGKYGSSIYFNGIDNYLNFGSILSGVYQNFTISMWIRDDGDNAYANIHRFIELGDVGYLAEMNGWANEYENCSMVSFSGNVGAEQLIVCELNIANKNWHHLVMTFNGITQNETLWFDGVPYSQTTSSTETQYISSELLFGTSHFDSAVVNGSIDEVGIFNRVLPDEEILDIYHDCNLTHKDMTLQFSSYPYSDVNNSFIIDLFSDFSYSNAFYLKVNGSDFFVNHISGNHYQIYLNFTELGDYPFTIYSESPCNQYNNFTGILKVRQPYYITIELYKSKGNNSFWNSLFGRYKNDFSFITAEFRNNYDTFTNKYVVPLDKLSKTNVFHSSYTDGQAVLKLWDNGEYTLRLIDGEITFQNVYSKPNITKSFGVNAYLGNFNFNGTDTSYTIYVSNNDLHPFSVLLNWALIILLVITAIGVIIMATEFPTASVMAGIFIILILFAGRIVIYFWIGS